MTFPVSPAGVNRQTASVPEGLSLAESARRPVSVTYRVPLASVAMSFRNDTPSMQISPAGSPVVRTKRRKVDHMSRRDARRARRPAPVAA